MMNTAPSARLERRGGSDAGSTLVEPRGGRRSGYRLEPRGATLGSHRQADMAVREIEDTGSAPHRERERASATAADGDSERATQVIKRRAAGHHRPLGAGRRGQQLHVTTSSLQRAHATLHARRRSRARRSTVGERIAAAAARPPTATGAAPRAAASPTAGARSRRKSRGGRAPHFEEATRRCAPAAARARTRAAAASHGRTATRVDGSHHGVGIVREPREPRLGRHHASFTLSARQRPPSR